MLLFFAVIGKQDPKMIKCYHEDSGGKFQHCMKDDGFETCFSKFDHSKAPFYPIFSNCRPHDHMLSKFDHSEQNFSLYQLFTL